VARSGWSYRNQVWWAHTAAALAVAVGLIGIIGATGAGGPAEVAVATLITVAGLEAKARWPGLPSSVLAVWTGAPAVIINVRGRSEAIMFLLVIVVSFVALTEADRRVSLAIGAAGVLAPAGIAPFAEHSFGWPFWMMGIAFGWLSGVQMRRFRRLVDELEATREQLAAQAVHLERRRIAADLHDLVGHSLTVVLLYLTGARRQLQDDPAGAAGALQEAEEIRRNVAALRDTGDGSMEPTPGAADLVNLVNQLLAAGSMVDLQVTGDLASVEAIIGVVVYRVVQESLNNAARHAPHAAVRVEVAVGPDAVEVSVVNGGGIGGGEVSGGAHGVGLIGMRERVEAVGGTLSAGPAGDAWAVRARVPRPALVDQP
jgi:signal transduction histidine kinase